MGLVSLQQSPRELHHPLCHVMTQWEGSVLWNRKWALTSHPISQHADLGLPGFRTVRNKSVLFINLWYFCHSSLNERRQHFFPVKITELRNTKMATAGPGKESLLLFLFCSFFPFCREKAFLHVRKMMSWDWAHRSDVLTITGIGSLSKCDSQASSTGITVSV